MIEQTHLPLLPDHSIDDIRSKAAEKLEILYRDANQSVWVVTDYFQFLTEHFHPGQVLFACHHLDYLKDDDTYGTPVEVFEGPDDLLRHFRIAETESDWRMPARLRETLETVCAVEDGSKET